MIMPNTMIKPSQSLFYKSLLILKELKNTTEPVEIFLALQNSMSAKDFILCLNYLFIIGEITMKKEPSDHLESYEKPNDETIEAMEDAINGKVNHYNSVDELFDDWEQ